MDDTRDDSSFLDCASYPGGNTLFPFIVEQIRNQ